MIKKKSRLLSCLILLFATFKILGQNSDVRLSAMEEEIKNLMDTYQTVGLAIAIIEADSVIHSRGFGYRNYREKLPVTSNTLFPIGSVTKPVTASLIGIYQGRGKLSMRDRPQKHIKGLQFYSDEMNKLVTIEDLLAHRSGIGVVDGAHVFFPTGDLSKHLARLPHLKPNSKFRERFDYSNMGYAILGGITEAISGQSWEKNVKEEIFKPLGMKHSNTSLKALQKQQNFSLGYSLVNDSIIQVEYEDQYESVASGAINSSVKDLAKWVRMLLNQGVHENQQLIPKEYLESSFSEHNIIRGSFSFDKKYELLSDTYGYGWFVHQYKDLYRVNHGGNVSGFTASVCLYPHKKIGVIILTNQGGANLLIKAIDDIVINRLLGRERKTWTDYKIQVGTGTFPVTKMKPINQDKKPSHLLSAYCGKYKDEGYGTLTVFIENENLMVEFPAFKMGLEHQHYNTFINRVVTKSHQNTPSFYIDFFSKNSRGDIDEMTIGFSQEPIRFKKLNE